MVIVIFHLCALSTFWQQNSSVNCQNRAPPAASVCPLPPPTFPAFFIHAFFFSNTRLDIFLCRLEDYLFCWRKIQSNLTIVSILASTGITISLSDPITKRKTLTLNEWQANKCIAQCRLIRVIAHRLVSSLIDSAH